MELVEADPGHEPPSRGGAVCPALLPLKHWHGTWPVDRCRRFERANSGGDLADQAGSCGGGAGSVGVATGS